MGARSDMLRAMADLLDELDDFVLYKRDGEGASTSTAQARLGTKVGYHLSMPAAAAGTGRHNKTTEFDEIVVVTLTMQERRGESVDSLAVLLDREDEAIGAVLGSVPKWGIFLESIDRGSIGGGFLQATIQLRARATLDWSA